MSFINDILQVYTIFSESAQMIIASLMNLPYNPTSWYWRATALPYLGCPELCLGDAHRARLLVEAALVKTTGLGDNALLVYGLGEWIENASQWKRNGLDKFKLYVTSQLRKLEKQIWMLITNALWNARTVWDEILFSDTIHKKAGGPQAVYIVQR